LCFESLVAFWNHLSTIFGLLAPETEPKRPDAMEKEWANKEGKEEEWIADEPKQDQTMEAE
jgi:hypothetical protein